METLNLKISGMSCAMCVGHVTGALQATPGVTNAVVDLDSHSARVEGENLDIEQLKAAVEEEGYEAEVA